MDRRVMIGGVSIDKQCQCGHVEHYSVTPLPFYPLPPYASYIVVMPISSKRWLWELILAGPTLAQVDALHNLSILYISMGITIT
jgi:hypothetical protein